MINSRAIRTICNKPLPDITIQEAYSINQFVGNFQRTSRELFLSEGEDAIRAVKDICNLYVRILREVERNHVAEPFIFAVTTPYYMSSHGLGGSVVNTRINYYKRKIFHTAGSIRNLLRNTNAYAEYLAIYADGKEQFFAEARTFFYLHFLAKYGAQLNETSPSIQKILSRINPDLSITLSDIWHSYPISFHTDFNNRSLHINLVELFCANDVFRLPMVVTSGKKANNKGLTIQNTVYTAPEYFDVVSDIFSVTLFDIKRACVQQEIPYEKIVDDIKSEITVNENDVWITGAELKNGYAALIDNVWYFIPENKTYPKDILGQVFFPAIVETIERKKRIAARKEYYVKNLPEVDR